MLISGPVLGLHLQEDCLVETYEFTWKIIQNTCPAWGDSYAEGMETVHVGHSGGEPAFLVVLSAESKSQLKLDFKRKRERKGPWSPTELPTSCDILLFAPCPRQNFQIKRQETILIISNFWSTERQRYSKTRIYNLDAFYLRFLGGNSINSTKYTWLDFSSFFGLDFSAMPVYLCVKIMLNNEFKISQWQPPPLFLTMEQITLFKG